MLATNQLVCACVLKINASVIGIATTWYPTTGFVNCKSYKSNNWKCCKLMKLLTWCIWGKEKHLIFHFNVIESFCYRNDALPCAEAASNMHDQCTWKWLIVIFIYRLNICCWMSQTLYSITFNTLWYGKCFVKCRVGLVEVLLGLLDWRAGGRNGLSSQMKWNESEASIGRVLAIEVRMMNIMVAFSLNALTKEDFAFS